MSAPHPTPAVERIDIRGRDRADAVGVIDATLARREQAQRRLLLLADVGQLESLHDQMRRLLGVANLLGLIVVAVGPAYDRERGVAVRRDHTLTGKGVLTVWVGDLEGVPWTMSAPTGDSLPRLTHQLDHLMSVLSAIEIFDPIAVAAEAIPYQVVCPGFRMVVGQVDTSILATVLLKALTDMVGPTHGAGSPRLDDDQTLVEGSKEEPNPILAGSPLDLARRDAAAAVKAIDDRVGRLTEPISIVSGKPGREAWRAVTDAHQQVLLLIERIRQVLAPGASAQQVTQAGIDTRPPGNVDHSQVAERIHALVGPALATHSLHDLATELAQVRDRTAPAGTGAHLDRLHNMAKPLESRPEPPVYPVAAGGLLSGLAAAASCALAALGSRSLTGLVTGGLAALVWVALSGLVIANRPAPAGRRWSPAAVAELTLQAGFAGAGAVAGALLGRGLHVPVAVTAATAVLGLCGVLAAAWWWRVRATARWIAEIGARRLADQVRKAGQILRGAATGEWVRRDARAYYSRLAGAVATMCWGLADGGADYLSSQPSRASTNAPEAQPGGRLYATVRTDLAEAALSVVDDVWPNLIGGAPERVRTDSQADFVKVLGAYREHLLTHNLHRPPSFVRSRRDYDGAGQAWRRTTALDAAIGAGAQSLMRQMCAETDLPLLNPDPGNTTVITFAPASARAAVLPDGADPDRPGSNSGAGSRPSGATEQRVRWIDGGYVAGTLRLVPVRGQAVDDFIATEGRVEWLT